MAGSEFSKSLAVRRTKVSSLDGRTFLATIATVYACDLALMVHSGMSLSVSQTHLVSGLGAVSSPP